MENYSDWNIKVEKLQEFYLEQYQDIRCCPKKYTWINESSDSLGNKISRYLPFDAYLIPRNCVDAFIDEYCINLLKYGIYCLTGNNLIYCGKTTNNDRGKCHNQDIDKSNWLWQLLFVPNNKCPNSMTYWNNENFMALLESLLIDKLYQHFGDYFTDKFRNKISGQTLQKAKDKLNNNIIQIEFAEIVADLIAIAYSDITGDDSFIISDKSLNQDWVYLLEHKPENTNEIHKSNNDLILKRIQEIQPNVDKLCWATNNVCLWKIKDEFDDEYISKIFGKEHQFLHLHYEFIRHDGKLYLEIHLEGSKSIDSTKYNQYKEFYKKIVDEKLNSTYIEDETIDGAIKIFKEIYDKVETIKF